MNEHAIRAPGAEGELADRAPQLPRGSCDCQLHVYAQDRSAYPIRHNRPLYDAPVAELSDALRMHEQVALDRLVLVQATVYTTDHALLLDSLAKLTPARARGVAIIDDSVTDDELKRLDAAGVRAARFNFQPRLGLVPSLDMFRRSVRRVQDLGWFIKIFGGPSELAEIADEIRRCEVPVVIDHMGHLNQGGAIHEAGLKLLRSTLEQKDRWVMLSNGHRLSARGYPWDDAVEVGRLLYETVPDRCIWGSDWPHVGSLGGPMPDDGDLVRLLLRYLPDNEAIERVLVTNPTKLFGF
ncbi:MULTISPECIES: amidohydrolase family protein [unclassified Beijerinckia]|uniref:amidohydrolase family protein n=1 Tax=unclassified Beijerinckia TaxID=2638183 RepID=UPI00089CB23A|nr:MULTISPECIES: amidohydrolase family protein [unclassified Beijerinckia]MDH7799713.1 2-pyrone-4,6-dicarboxylate lactonase [Beijerinckia sp. GAS462]SED34516.1 Predicted metal-dependent hydrolase, TIM-barrel fold [Beijerinckia sp. 28-YEA-48]